jgi:hypothetical protein
MAMQSMSAAQLHRFSLTLAIAGALMIVMTIYGNLWLQRTDFNLPVYEESRPALADWPDHAPRPRA